MKLSAILLFICASTLPASALAEGAANIPAAPIDAPVAAPKTTRVMKSKWTLKQKAGTEQAATVVGPPVPAPQRIRLPQKKGTKKATAQRSGIKPVNATPVVGQVLNRKRHD